jgi:hypothetical protein
MTRDALYDVAVGLGLTGLSAATKAEIRAAIDQELVR